MPTEIRHAAADIASALEENRDSERAEREVAYLRSSLRHIGVRVPTTRTITRRVMRAHKLTARQPVMELARTLWADPVHEHRLAAVEALRYRCAVLTTEDLGTIEQMVTEARTWALVDALAIDVVGRIAASDSGAGPTLDRWAGDDDLWLRRSALLALLQPLRGGDGDWERFSTYADMMLDEREFFIRKAIGWVLRETAKQRPQVVETWLRERPGRVPVLAVREAVKRMPADVRSELIAAAKRSRR